MRLLITKVTPFDLIKPNKVKIKWKRIFESIKFWSKYISLSVSSVVEYFISGLLSQASVLCTARRDIGVELSLYRSYISLLTRSLKCIRGFFFFFDNFLPVFEVEDRCIKS